MEMNLKFCYLVEGSIQIDAVDGFRINAEGEIVGVILDSEKYTAWLEGNSTFSSRIDDRFKEGYALLGNGKGKVKPWYLPFDWCFCMVNIGGYIKVRIVKNSVVGNVYGLAVKVVDGIVVGLWEYKPPVPAVPS